MKPRNAKNSKLKKIQNLNKSGPIGPSNSRKYKNLTKGNLAMPVVLSNKDTFKLFSYYPEA